MCTRRTQVVAGRARRLCHAHRRAFTLLEMILVVSILISLVALMVPVAKRAVRRAQVADSCSRLRQLHHAVMLYQLDHENSAITGTPHEMGLPDRQDISSWSWPAHLSSTSPGEVRQYPRRIFESACGKHPSESTSSFRYWISEPNWSENIDLYRENMILFADLNCSDPGIHIDNDLERKLGLGMLLSGQLVVHAKTGDANDPSYWAMPMEY